MYVKTQSARDIFIVLQNPGLTKNACPTVFPNEKMLIILFRTISLIQSMLRKLYDKHFLIYGNCRTSIFHEPKS